MTTEAAARAYLAAHLNAWADKGYAMFNPHGRPVEELPVIYGFNNGGSPGWYYGVLLAESGHCLGEHVCSNEGYMPHDLGILEGARPDRHETFMAHYPDGYRMDFVPSVDVKAHPGIAAAYARNRALSEAPDA